MGASENGGAAQPQSAAGAGLVCFKTTRPLAFEWVLTWLLTFGEKSKINECWAFGPIPVGDKQTVLSFVQHS